MTMANTANIFGVWYPTEKTLKGFRAMRAILAEDNSRLELGVYSLHNGRIQYHHYFDVHTLLSDWQELPFSSFSIAVFRKIPIGDKDDSSAISMFSTGHIAVMCIGVIDNLPEIPEKLISCGYQLDTKSAAESISYLFSNYLEFGDISAVDTMPEMMKHLKGHFVIMVLVAKGEWFMAGSHDYPLALSKDNRTVYFATDIETLAQYYPSEIIVDKRKSAIFGTTSFLFHIFESVA